MKKNKKSKILGFNKIIILCLTIIVTVVKCFQKIVLDEGSEFHEDCKRTYFCVHETKIVLK